jgi:carnitine O-acetyltransferase
LDFDPSGKVSLEHIYTQPDPRAYFDTLHDLEYQIPQLAKPYFTDLIGRYGRTHGVAVPTVLDLGCSYGINAALLTCDLTMDDLYARYRGADPGATHDELSSRDRDLTRARKRLGPAVFVGLDTSLPALSYALSAGFLDDAVHADLEADDPTESQRRRLARADLVFSTGCLGYISEKTLSRVVETGRGRRPWMAHFVLRMFPFEPVTDTLAALGYDTVRVDRMFRQRRFASAHERALVLDTLSTIRVDPSGLEDDGWLYAQLHISRPAGDR